MSISIGYNPATYGDNWAEVYDEHLKQKGMQPPDATVKFLSDLAGGFRILELGIGTGRIAVPLAEAGYVVHGIDASESMLLKLAERAALAGVPHLTWSCEDCARFDTTQLYGLVFAAYNTLLLLYSQAEQVQCFKSVGQALEQGGCFVVEAQVPQLEGFIDLRRAQFVREMGTCLELRVSEHDPVTQRLTGRYLWLDEQEYRSKPLLMRYAWPMEIDLMAQLAGLELEARFGDWDGGAFTAVSQKHVSVYRKSLSGHSREGS